MKLQVTKDCQSHRVNQDYQTLLVWLDRADTNTRWNGFSVNWMPTDEELKALVQAGSEISPTFNEWLIEYAHSINTWAIVPEKPRRVITGKTNIAEVMW